jgi:hypothetical protein
MTAGSSMLAMTASFPPQRAQASISPSARRLCTSRCALLIIFFKNFRRTNSGFPIS